VLRARGGGFALPSRILIRALSAREVLHDRSQPALDGRRVARPPPQRDDAGLLGKIAIGGDPSREIANPADMRDQVVPIARRDRSTVRHPNQEIRVAANPTQVFRKTSVSKDRLQSSHALAAWTGRSKDRIHI